VSRAFYALDVTDDEEVGESPDQRDDRDEHQGADFRTGGGDDEPDHRRRDDPGEIDREVIELGYIAVQKNSYPRR
jgi:hypothetical protein